MNWEIFNDKLSSEEDAIGLIRNIRETIGLHCAECGSNGFAYDKYNQRWMCKSCRKSIQLTVDTVMFRTQLPKLYWLKVIYCFALTEGTTRIKDIKPIEDKQTYLLKDLILKIRLLVSKYISENRSKYQGKRYTQIEMPTKINNKEKFGQMYTDELIFKKSIEKCDDWTKFLRLLSICLSYQNEFRHNDYGKNPAK
ncbi:MAG: hypothetical protein KBT41_02260 [bacterium]|nr:hypothetical protein [Candidatus Colousia faecequi]